MANELRKIINYSANDIDKLLQNGIYAVASEEEKDSLSPSIRTINRVVCVRATQKLYNWNGGEWEDVSISGGAEVVVGTQDNPIIFNELPNGKFYILSGYIKATSTSSKTYPFEYSMPIVKHFKDSGLAIGLFSIWGDKITVSGNIELVKCWVYSNNLRFDRYATIENLNGSAGLATSIYAPTKSGSVGQILQSNGSKAPEWVTPTFVTEERLEEIVGGVSDLLGETEDLEV